MEIRMVDTITQYEHIQAEVDQAVLSVVRSGQYINGPAVAQFSANLAEFMEVSHVIPCANGTDALQIALMALGLQPGDEVITPSFTYISTVEVVALLGLKPVFVEVDPASFNMSHDALAAAITSKTKAIIPVHLFGQAADMDAIMAIADGHGIPVIEDTAQAIGAIHTSADGVRRRVGGIGTIGTMSFYPSKNLGAYGDGGAIFTQDADLAAKLRMICNHGCSVRYYHDSIGVNSRLDAIQAAVLDIKLKHLEAYNTRRRQAARRYDALLRDCPGVDLPQWQDNESHAFHQYTIKLHGSAEQRNQVQADLKAVGVPSMIYYPVPCHLQQAYRKYGYQPGSFPVSERLCEQVISLPMHSELDEAQQRHIADAFTSAIHRLFITTN